MPSAYEIACGDEICLRQDKASEYEIPKMKAWKSLNMASMFFIIPLPDSLLSGDMGFLRANGP